MRTLIAHWPLYVADGFCLALFMMSAAGCAVALQHPLSPLAGWLMPGVAQRVPMGIAMGLTLAGLVYSPLGRWSGAHMNPAVTLTYFRLGAVRGSHRRDEWSLGAHAGTACPPVGELRGDGTRASGDRCCVRW